MDHQTATATSQYKTFAWASYVLPGFFAPRNGSDWALHDISIVTHEIAEWRR